MPDPVLCELREIVLGLVESHNVCYVEVLENLNIILWGLSASLLSLRPINWTHKGDKLARDDEVEVSVVELLVIFVFFVIKLSEVVPPVAGSKLQAFKTVEN